MGGSRYLVRRGLRWYFRLHIPEELQPFLGRDELRKSLKTSCYPVAKEAMRSELFRAERLFTRRTAALGSVQQAQRTGCDQAYGNLLNEWREALLGVSGTSILFSNEFAAHAG